MPGRGARRLGGRRPAAPVRVRARPRGAPPRPPQRKQVRSPRPLRSVRRQLRPRVPRARSARDLPPTLGLGILGWRLHAAEASHGAGRETANALRSAKTARASCGATRLQTRRGRLPSSVTSGEVLKNSAGPSRGCLVVISLAGRVGSGRTRPERLANPLLLCSAQSPTTHCSRVATQHSFHRARAAQATRHQHCYLQALDWPGPGTLGPLRLPVVAVCGPGVLTRHWRRHCSRNANLKTRPKSRCRTQECQRPRRHRPRPRATEAGGP